MSDEGEKTCPLCAEEMDLTDQQLKPCKCGYEICIWCWHHIMDMAEKDETEGRCPACRTPYDKERIVGTASKCERLVAEINMERKHKSQKAKIKTSDNRKQLSSVRVIQRNLVYIVGLPLNLADEDLLQCKEYFGQYGKVLKVSISRTSAGTIQQFANNTCSVYITYTKEDEAVRCIQSVHGFILDGKPLRACFGTTKYCHAWLRNVPCSNPDCLYLHEIGSHEDSFTKDEIISAYTRVQQITGVTNNMQRRSGTSLPPPADDYCTNSSAVGKPAIKSSTNNSASSIKASPPTSSSGRSGALPPAASWGTRASNFNPAAGSLVCSNGPTKQKAEVISGQPVLLNMGWGSTQASVFPSDVGKKLKSNEDFHARQTINTLEMVDSLKLHVGVNSQINVSEESSKLLDAPAVKSTSPAYCPPAADSNNDESSLTHNISHSIDGKPSLGVYKGGSSVADEKISKLCSELSSISIGKRRNGEQSPNGLCLDNLLSPGSRGSKCHDVEELQEHPTSVATSKAANSDNSERASREECHWKSDVQALGIQNLTSETEDDFDNQRLRDAIVVSQTTVPISPPLHLLSQLRGPLEKHVDADSAVNYMVNPPSVNRMLDGVLDKNVSGTSVVSDGFLENFVSRTSSQGSSCLILNGGHGNHIGRFDAEMANVEPQPAVDMGESSIISNILSLDLDSWNDSLTSPQNLAKLLGETDRQEGPLKLASSWKGQMSNQSRFSFARQEDSRNHLFDFKPSLSNIGQAAKSQAVGQSFVENRDPYLDRLGNGFVLPPHIIEPSDNVMSGHSIFPPGKHSSSALRSQISAPPGFSAPSRPPPPGFPSHDRTDQTFDIKSGHHFLETSSLLRNPYQALPSGNVSTASDIEFIDPAILAVGKGRLPIGVNNSGSDMRSNFHVQAPVFDNDSRLNFLMQRSHSPHQNLIYTDVRDNFSPPNDVYGFSSRHMDQSQSSNLPAFSQFSLQHARNIAASNGHWDGWSEVQPTNDMGIMEVLRNDRLGLNKFYGGYEDSKFRLTNSGDLYNRSFGM